MDDINVDTDGCGTGCGYGILRTIGRFLIAPFRVDPDDRPIVTFLWLVTWGLIAFPAVVVAGVIPDRTGIPFLAVLSAIGAIVLIFILGNWDADHREVKRRFDDPVDDALDDLTSGRNNRYPR